MKYLISSRVIYALALAVCCCQCAAPEQKQTFNIPPGMSIRSQFTTRMGDDQLPTDNITYLIPTMDNVTVYSSFEGITAGAHSYQWVLHNAQGGHACPQMAPYSFQTAGGTENVWSKISVAQCLSVPGNYKLLLYLDGNAVHESTLKVLTNEEMSSGEYAAYWNANKYFPMFEVPAKPGAGKWTVSTIATNYERTTGLWVFPHRGSNRVFVLSKHADGQLLREYTRYGWQEIYTVPEPGEESELQCKVLDDVLYFYNTTFQGSYNLVSEAVQSGITLPFDVPARNEFVSPDGSHQLTRNGELDGKSLRTSANACGCGNVVWAQWSADNGTLHFTIDCCENEPDELYRYDFATRKATRLETSFAELPYTITYAMGGMGTLKSSAVLPLTFNNSGIDFIGFVQKSEGQAERICIATRAQYEGNFGFGDNYIWNGSIAFPAVEQDQGGSYLKVTFLSQPVNYLQYAVSSDEGMSYKTGLIKHIGKVAEGTWAGGDVYALRDDEQSDGKESGGEVHHTEEDVYLVRHGRELIAINMSNEVLNSGFVAFPDPDGNRMRSSLFKDVERVVVSRNQFITKLLSPAELELPESVVKLKRMGNVKDPGSNSNYSPIYNHPQEGELFVRQNDDGSFWRFNGDGTATLYTYNNQFTAMIGDREVNLDGYVPFTNQGCYGNPLDFAHIVSIDPARLKEVSPGAPFEPLYSFANTSDELLRSEYDVLSEAYKSYGNDFPSFEKFLDDIPLFLWKDPFGRYIRFLRRDLLAPTNCEPILYLYPEIETNIQVSLGERVDVISSLPAATDTWHVRATPNGKLTDPTTQRTYDHIFWEGIAGVLPPLEKGFVVDTSQLITFFDEKLQTLGLNASETDDFKKAWLKEFGDARYYFIGFYDRRVIDKYAPMTIEPRPETVIRILMDYRPLKSRIPVASPQLESPGRREGFTVVEWAGLKR